MSHPLPGVRAPHGEGTGHVDNAAEDLGRNLWLLYAQAGKPDLDLLCSRLPVGFQLTTATVQKWLSSEEVPSSLDELSAFIDELHAVLAESGKFATHPKEQLHSLWYRIPENSDYRKYPAQADPPSPETLSGTNRIDGNSRINGPSIQAREISGDVHFHSDDGSSAAQYPPTIPVMRVQSEHETIEIYDEGLAHYWIRARLRRGSDSE